MGWLEFFASVVGDVLSWPVAVVVIAILLRIQLRELLKRLRHSKVFGQDFHFGDVLERAEEATALAAADAESRTEADSEPRSEPDSTVVDDNALSNPSGLVIARWERVDAAIRDLHTAAGLPTSERRTTVAMARQLEEARIFNSEYVDSVVNLQKLRSLVAHGRHEPNVGEAAGFANAANELTRSAESLLPLVVRGREITGKPWGAH
jgi:hypothetical protein